MPTYLKLINDTPTVWMCRVSIDEQYFAYVGMLFSIIGMLVLIATAIAWVVTKKAAAATLVVVTLICNIFGFVADVGGFTVALTGTKLALKSADKGYQDIPVNEFEVWKYKQFSPVWLQAKCMHSSQREGNYVKVSEFSMLRLSPGRKSEEIKSYSLQAYLDENGAPDTFNMPIGSMSQYQAAVDSRAENRSLGQLQGVLNGLKELENSQLQSELKLPKTNKLSNLRAIAE